MSLKERFQEADARNKDRLEQDRTANMARIPKRWGCLKTLGVLIIVGIVIWLIVIVLR